MTQGLNLGYGKRLKKIELRNSWVNAQNLRVEAAKNVQQVADCALFFSRKGGKAYWIQGAVISGKTTLKIDVTVRYGTPEYEKVLYKLVAQGRQGIIARKGEILLHLEGRNILVQNHFGK